MKTSTAHTGSHCPPPHWPTPLHQQDPASTEAATLLQRTHHIADTLGMTTLTNRYTRHGLLTE